MPQALICTDAATRTLIVVRINLETASIINNIIGIIVISMFTNKYFIMNYIYIYIYIYIIGLPCILTIFKLL